MALASEKTFGLDLARLVDAGSSGDPEQLLHAVEREFEPVLEHLRLHTHPADLDKLRWILIELVSNSLTAPLGKALSERTGLARRQLLDAFGTSVLWPHPSRLRVDQTGTSAVHQRLQSAIGCSADAFLKLSLRERFEILGVALDEDWLRVIVRYGEAEGSFEVLVESDHGPSEDDHREILSRFVSYESEKTKVGELRKGYEDENGVYHIPSFTGGGGAGLLVCIQTAKERGLDFEYIADDARLGKTTFRVAKCAAAGIPKSEVPNPHTE